jgi:hypothetical protein
MDNDVKPAMIEIVERGSSRPFRQEKRPGTFFS